MNQIHEFRKGWRTECRIAPEKTEHFFGPISTLRGRIKIPTSQMRDCLGLFQTRLVSPKAYLRLLALGDVALDAKHAGNTILRVIHANIIAFDPDRRAVILALF